MSERLTSHCLSEHFPSLLSSSVSLEVGGGQGGCSCSVAWMDEQWCQWQIESGRKQAPTFFWTVQDEAEEILGQSLLWEGGGESCYRAGQARRKKKSQFVAWAKLAEAAFDRGEGLCYHRLKCVRSVLASLILSTN